MKKMNIMKYVRPSIKDFEPYIAGKPVEMIKRELGLKRVIKLASNENPLGPCKNAIAAIKASASKVFFYPDSDSFTLKEVISKKCNIDKKNIILGAGSDEIIEVIAKTFFNPGDEIVVSEHAFIRYQMAGDLMNTNVITIPMKDFTHDLDKMAKAVTSKTKAVFIANPNNPTGTYNTATEVKTFLDRVNKKAVPPIVIFDEAYFEYARAINDYPDSRELLASYPTIVSLRTFSKVYGLAGLRVGYGFASPEIVGYLDRVRPPFNINVCAQEAAAASIVDPLQVAKGCELVEDGKKYLYDTLAGAGIGFVPSATNFLLIDVSPMTGNDVFKELLKKGIIVRAMDEYRYYNHIRVTIDLPANMKLFIRELRHLLNK